MNSQSPFVSVQDMVDFRAEGEKMLHEEHSADVLKYGIDKSVAWAGREFTIARLKLELISLEARQRWEGK